MERVLDVMFWFYNQCVENNPLFQIIKENEIDEIYEKREKEVEDSQFFSGSSDNNSDTDEESERLGEEKYVIQVVSLQIVLSVFFISLLRSCNRFF